MASPKNDRRSQRTRRILLDAMVSLMQEKPYDAITVQDIIDRADVGRSTFYAHYQDKEDLMAGVLAHMMDALSHMAEQRSGADHLRILPGRELFEHVQENYPLFKGVVRGHSLELFFDRAMTYWSQRIAAELQAFLPEGQQPAVPIPVIAHFVSSTLVMMLHWWLNNKMPYSPKEMDDMLQSLIMPGIQNSLAGKEPNLFT